MALALTALATLCLGAILSAAIPRASGVGVSPEMLAKLPAITTPAFRFEQKEIRVKAGQIVALRLNIQHDVPHSLDIDELNVHASMPVGQSELALFTPAKPGTYTFYCSLPGHRAAGMQGTLIVEP
jgi:plastocyanin